MPRKRRNSTFEIGSALAIGFLGAGYLGNYIENKYKPGVTKDSSNGDKAMAWAFNNGPKFLGLATMSTKNRIVNCIGYGIEGSLLVDTVLRFMNSGAPTTRTLFGIHVLSNNLNNGSTKCACEQITQQQTKDIVNKM